MSWLSANTRPDLCIFAHNLAKKSNSATVADLKRINHIVARIQEHPNKVVLTHVGRPEDLVVIGFGDAAFSQSERKVG